MNNLSICQRKLIEAARKIAPSDRVPYAFEKRIMARLAALPAVDSWTAWGNAFWRAAVVCVTVTMLFGAWSFSPLGQPKPAGMPENFSQELDRCLLAGLDLNTEEIW